MNAAAECPKKIADVLGISHGSILERCGTGRQPMDLAGALAPGIRRRKKKPGRFGPKKAA